MIEGSIITPAATVSGKTYGLVNPNDLVQHPNNMDVVPAGTGPSNLSSGGEADPYVVQIQPTQ